MARVLRIVYPDIPHHVTVRGNRREDIFLDDADRQMYLKLLARNAGRAEVSIQAYCLMGNHVHLVVTPSREEGLARTMHATQSVYAQYLNAKHDWDGHVFGSRYYSCPLDEEHLWKAIRYAEQNPVRAGMVQHALDWPWSSAPAHCGGVVAPFLDIGIMKSWTGADWRDWLGDRDEEGAWRVREATRIGRPLGSKEFISKIEEFLGMNLGPKKRGRPPGGVRN